MTADRDDRVFLYDLLDKEGNVVSGERRALPQRVAVGEGAAGEYARMVFVGEFVPPAPGYRDLRAVAYIDQLGKPEGRKVFEEVVGDVLDELIAQAEATRLAAGAQRTAGFDALLTKIAAIKAAYPRA